jgi:SsrA-binding protein
VDRESNVRALDTQARTNSSVVEGWSRPSLPFQHPEAVIAKPAAKPEAEETQSIARNKRARFDYEILDSWEAGIVLTGTEVKSLREGKAKVTDAYGIVKDGELWLLNLHIAPYEQGNRFNHEATRTRKLLLHGREINRLIGAVERQGLTIVALELYFKHGRAKVRIALARGKKLHDKRADLKKKDDQREMARAVKVRR